MTHVAPALVEVTRRDERTGRAVVESSHQVHVVLTIDGHVTWSLGDPDRATYLRSSVKAVQAATCLDLLSPHPDLTQQLTSEHLAVAWASHRAEDVHVRVVRSLCEVAGIETEQLTCPADRRPDGAADDLARVHHNCSGKHALFALAGRALGADRSVLLDPTGPLQTPMLARLDHELGGVTAVAIDGCGAPAVQAQLSSLAGFFGRFAQDDDWSVLRDAGLAHPRLIGGQGRLESSLLADGTMAKLGAEGVYGAGWVRDGRQIGVAVKAQDGATRAAAAVLAEVVVASGRSLGDWPGQRASGGGQVVGDVTVPSEVGDAVRRRFN